MKNSDEKTDMTEQDYDIDKSFADDEMEESQQLYEHFRFEVDRGQVPVRIDKFMFEKLQHSSRNRIQKGCSLSLLTMKRASPSKLTFLSSL